VEPKHLIARNITPEKPQESKKQEKTTEKSGED
jgi:hypothetical protein